MLKLISQLEKDFPDLTFKAGERFTWSPENQSVIYKISDTPKSVEIWSLLHEVGHALLGHNTYETDFELVQMEAAAWQKAEELGKIYGHGIDQEHVQDCLDTYRDWLYRRSLCPACSLSSLQIDSRTYRCFNCGSEWQVSKSKLCRPYRLSKLKEASV